MSEEDRSSGIPARIVEEQKGRYRVASSLPKIIWAELAGRLLYEIESSGDYPSVGDWVVIHVETGAERAMIQRILPRRTKLSRRAPETGLEQVMAANVDVAFLLSSLNQDLSLNRIERCITVANQCGVAPVVLLTKTDLCTDVESKVQAVKTRLQDVEVLAISTLQKTGMDAILAHLTVGRTSVLLGSSGVGKSTLTNSLVGGLVQKTQAIREGDDKGKHTTTFRRLITLPQAGMIIDTPGIRELQLWDGTEGVEQTFEDIESLATSCRFSNCQHQTEPNCAVQGALVVGSLDPARYENYQKLQREVEFAKSKKDKAVQSERNKKVRKIHKEGRKGKREK